MDTLAVTKLLRTSRWYPLLCALGLLLSLSATGAEERASSRPAHHVGIQFNWMYQFEFAGPIAAKEKGFYRDVGLEVDLIQGGPAVDPITPVAENRIEFGIAGSSLIVERARGKPVVALASLMQHSAVGLLAPKQAGIRGASDLAGKRLAISFDTADEIQAYLTAQGLAENDYVRLGKHLDLADLRAGRADAISIYVSNELFLVQPHIDDFVVLTPESAGIDLFGNVLFTSEAMLRRQPQTVAAFRGATIKGWEYALAHPEEIADLIVARYNSQQKSREHLLYEAAKLKELTRLDLVEAGYMSLGRWQHVRDIYAVQKKIPADFNLEGFVYRPATAKVLPAWMLWALAGALAAAFVSFVVAARVRALNRRLRTEIAEREKAEAALREAKQAAESANLAKSRFLATMSHEIRTPLNGVLGMAQLLQMPGVGEAERTDYARTIIDSGKTLLTLLNDILDLSKVEAGKLRLEFVAVTPAQILHNVNTLFAEIARARNLHLVADWSGPPCQYRLDAHRLRQMLGNLIDNAIKFTAAGTITVDARELAREDGIALLEFSVADTGIGIAADKLPLLFQAFTQADSSITRSHGGTGLGLSIVASLARLMGGDTGVNSEPGNGSRFWFRIRADLVEEATASGEPWASPATSPAAEPLAGDVLIVEDNTTNRVVLASMLKSLGLGVVAAEDGEQAVRRIMDGERPDAILMDVEMPVLDGLAAAARIRQWEAERTLPPLPIIAVTANAYDADRQRCLAAGMNDFLAKPVNREALRATLLRWINRPH